GQNVLGFHERLAGGRADGAEAEDGGAVRDDGDEVPLGRVLVDVLGIPGDLEARLGHARRVGEREVALGGGRLGGDDLDFAGASDGVVFERFVVDVGHEG